MHYIVTTCCKDKDPDQKDLPAIERYLDPRIKLIATLATDEIPFLIFSGKFGLIKPSHLIPWYDYALQFEGIDTLLPLLKQQIKALQITTLTAHLLPKDTPGWGPYHKVFQILSEQITVDIVMI